MARTSLFQNKKFKRLVARLAIPRPQVVGLLELMWHACYETGDPVFANHEEIEAAAEWWGEPSAFASAAVLCGLIDAREDGEFEVHDFWDHAPRAAASRREREEERKIPRTCEGCGGEFHTSDRRAKFCSGACKQRHYRNSVTDRVTHRSVTVTDRYAAPDTRHPTPDTNKEKSMSPDGDAETAEKRQERGAETRQSPKGEEFPPGFVAFWKEWPRHPRKVGKSQCLRLWKRAELERIAEQVIESLRRCKVSRDWTKSNGDFIPLPLSWLNKTPWETEAEETGIFQGAAAPPLTRTIIRGEM